MAANHGPRRRPSASWEPGVEGHTHSLTNTDSLCNQDGHHRKNVVWEQRVAGRQRTMVRQPGWGGFLEEGAFA